MGTVNKIIGGILVLGNILYFIPQTIKLISTGGGPMGYGILIIPLFLSINAFLFTGILAFIKRDTFPRTSAMLFIISLTLLFIGGLLSFTIPIIALFTMVPTLLLLILGITKASEKNLLALNICGLAAILNATILLVRT